MGIQNHKDWRLPRLGAAVQVHFSVVFLAIDDKEEVTMKDEHDTHENQVSYAGFNRLARVRTAIIACAISAALLGGSTPALAQSNSEGRTIEGVWSMVVTVRDCTTGVPLGPPFRSLVTFHRGGTISESVGTLAFAPGQRTPAHGLWSRDGGSTYSLRMVAAILFDTNPPPPAAGFTTGWQVISGTHTLSDADHQTASAVVEFYDMDGQIYRTACPTSVGQRFR